ncbi:hypothetical protein HY68_09345 [Streptomyces sp. AcH 505]|nr:hypothetical protein HY68_09345 [Streptomyces sp. AcH 505]
MEPVDPDIDLQMPAQRAELAAGHPGPVLAVISAGGAVGAAARYGAILLWPTPAGAFPWTVFWINLLGCGLIGVLMVLVSEEGRSAHRLVRPFLGVGVLGGFTTFSTYASGFADLLTRDEAGRALAYAAGTLAGAMAAVWAAATVTRRLVHRTEAAR